MSIIPLVEPKNLTFRPFTEEDIVQQQTVEILNQFTIKDGKPTDNGLNDLHMGATKFYPCKTCGNNFQSGKCMGHTGCMTLKYPLQNVLFLKHIKYWLFSICLNCYDTILDLAAFKKSKNISDPFELLHELHDATSKTNKLCHACEKPKINIKSNRDMEFGYMIEGTLKNSYKKLLNSRIKEIFSKVPNKIVTEMGFDLYSHPKNLLTYKIPIPANSITPEYHIPDSNISKSDDITNILSKIFTYNQSLPQNYNINNLLDLHVENMDLMNALWITCIKQNKSASRFLLSKHSKLKTLKPFASRIMTKTGLIRSNILGKRCNYSSRTVLTGNQQLYINEVGVPVSIAKKMLVMETVRENNYEFLNNLYLNKNEYPGCEYVVKKSDNQNYLNSKLNNYKLCIGDKVYRHLLDNDHVGFHRPPSLLISNLSTMRVKVLPGTNTFSHNVIISNYFNSDFDGDVMTIFHAVNQSVMSEIKILGNALCWVKDNASEMCRLGLHQDSIISCYLLSKELDDISRDFFSYCRYDKLSELRHIKKNGYGLLSMLLPKISYRKTPSTYYKKIFEDCIPYKEIEKKVVIENGIVKSGVFDKSVIGNSQTNTIFQILANDYSMERTSKIVRDLQRTLDVFLFKKGLSVTIQNIMFSDEIVKKNKDKTNKMIKKALTISSMYFNGLLVSPIDKSKYSHFETLQQKILTQDDEYIKDTLRQVDFKDNTLANLIFSGSKGKLGQFTNINASIGQVYLSGKRLEYQLSGLRTHPYFRVFDTDPASRGFVKDCYFAGVKNKELWSLFNEGKDSMITNALSTSISGVYNRNMSKSLELLTVDNLRRCMRQDGLFDLLFNSNGFEIRHLERNQYPLLGKTKQFIQEHFSNSQEIFEECMEVHSQYYDFVSSDSYSLAFDFSFLLPINFGRFVRVIHNKSLKLEKEKKMYIGVDSVYAKIEKNAVVFDPKDYEYDQKDVAEFCSGMARWFLNDSYKGTVPDYHRDAVKPLQHFTRIYLDKKFLKSKKLKLNFRLFKKCLKMEFKKKLVDPGLVPGIKTAYCICEPLMQSILNAKHRIGIGGTTMDLMNKFSSYIYAKKPKSENKYSSIFFTEEWETDEKFATKFNDYLIPVEFSSIIDNIYVLDETLADIRDMYEEFSEDAEWINMQRKLYINVETLFCIRIQIDFQILVHYEYDKEFLISFMSDLFPESIIICSPDIGLSEENASIIMRIYITNETSSFIQKNIYNTQRKKTPMVKNVVGAGIKQIFDSFKNNPYEIVEFSIKLKDKDLESIRSELEMECRGKPVHIIDFSNETNQKLMDAINFLIQSFIDGTHPNLIHKWSLYTKKVIGDNPDQKQVEQPGLGTIWVPELTTEETEIFNLLKIAENITPNIFFVDEEFFKSIMLYKTFKLFLSIKPLLADGSGKIDNKKILDILFHNEVLPIVEKIKQKYEKNVSNEELYIENLKRNIQERIQRQDLSNNKKLGGVANTINKIFKNIIQKITSNNIFSKQTFDHIIKNTTKKKNFNYKLIVDYICDQKIENVTGILNSKVMKKKINFIQGNKIMEKTIFYIKTLGSNLEKILPLPFIDSSKTTSSDMFEMKEFFGIDIARKKMISELKSDLGSTDHSHFDILSRELTYTGNIRSIKAVGSVYEKNTLLKMSFGDPIKGLVKAALQNTENDLSGCSSAMMIGKIAKFGTTYNNVVLDLDQSIKPIKQTIVV